MPLYEYECAACHRRFERIQKFTDPSIDVCPNCGQGPVRKLVSSPAIQFKGSGWYITDYARKSASDASKSASGDPASSSSSSSSESGTSAASADAAKPAAKKEKKD
jgi:putative FmdB family regulatory protein